MGMNLKNNVITAVGETVESPLIDVVCMLSKKKRAADVRAFKAMIECERPYHHLSFVTSSLNF